MSDKNESESSPFPEAKPGDPPAGTVSGGNGLYRNNYRDGRVLTAGALQNEQRYLDARARVVAQAFPSGVVWGLGLSLPDTLPAPGASLSRGYAVDLDGQSKLQPGLAFDAAGRPIAVGGEFVFSFRELLEQSAARPKEVVSGGTAFQPCVCLRAAPARSAGGFVQSGPYLLVLSPEERPEGEAKLYGVRTQSPIGCVSDGWRGGFGLSLARLDLDMSSWNSNDDVWSRRGALVAWLFDTKERDLSARWASGLPGAGISGDGDLGAPPVASAVPLALVYIAPDGGVLFCDRWAARRPVVESAPAAWYQAALGGETKARALARSRQFQSMLLESLTVQQMNPGGAQARPQDLYARGFRHLPAAGLLPVPSVSIGGLGVLDQARSALRSARAYFQGTNVLTGEEIAVHDDLILSELDAASALDPIRLTPAPAAPTGGTPLDDFVQQPSLRRFGNALLAADITVEQLTSEAIVLVRLIAALRTRSGEVSPHPFVAFVRQPVAFALDLPPPPEQTPDPPPPSTEELRVTITDPKPDTVLWVHEKKTFTWLTTGGTAPIVHTAKLVGDVIQGAQRTPTPAWLVVDGQGQGQGGSLVIPDWGWSGDVTLTVTATDANDTEKTAEMLVKVAARDVSFVKEAATPTRSNVDEGLYLAWTVTEGWTPVGFSVRGYFIGVEANESPLPSRGMTAGPLETESTAPRGEFAMRDFRPGESLAGSQRNITVSLLRELGANNHLVGKVRFSITAWDSTGFVAAVDLYTIEIVEPETLEEIRRDYSTGMAYRLPKRTTP